MIITVTMKCPDAVEDAITNAIEDIEDDEARETARQRAQAVMAKWFRYGEYLTVLVDTETKTCTPQPQHHKPI